MNEQKKFVLRYHSMLILTIIAGVMGIGFLFMPDSELLSFMVTVAVLGGLIGGSKDYNESERQQLARSYKTAFEWLLLAMLAAFALIVSSRLFPGLKETFGFLNAQWPCLVLSIMCIVMGFAGLKKDKPA